MSNVVGSEIVKFSPTGTATFRFGSFGDDDVNLNAPFGLSVDSLGQIYVADVINQKVKKFDSSGNFLVKFCAVEVSTSVFCDTPRDVDLDSHANVYIADTNHGRILKYDSEGNLLTIIDKDSSGFGQAFSPFGLAVSESGDTVYVTDVGNGRVLVFAATAAPDTIPPETAILSVKDIKGNDVEDGALTLSTSITFTFSGLDNIDGPADLRFECDLDGEDIAECDSPLQYSNLQVDHLHTFEVRAIDTSKNVDPSPSAFSWKILSPSGAIKELKEKVHSYDLKKGVEKHLLVPLKKAARLLDDENTTNDKRVCVKLDNFIHKVDRNESKGRISSTQSDELKQLSEAIHAYLGC